MAPEHAALALTGTLAMVDRLAEVTRQLLERLSSRADSASGAEISAVAGMCRTSVGLNQNVYGAAWEQLTQRVDCLDDPEYVALLQRHIEREQRYLAFADAFAAAYPEEQSAVLKLLSLDEAQYLNQPQDTFPTATDTLARLMEAAGRPTTDDRQQGETND